MLTTTDQKRMESLKALFDWHRSEINSERNITCAKKWTRKKGVKNPRGAFKLFLGASFCSRALEVDIQEMDTDPALYLETQLRLKKLIYEKYRDDAPLSYAVGYNPGATMEASIYGAHVVHLPDREAYESHNSYIIREYSDLASLPTPDFYNSDTMRHVHRMYGGMKEIASSIAPDFAIGFPGWFRSPFAVACSLRGMERICLDFYDNPLFVHRLMARLAEGQIAWEKERAKFMNESSGLSLGNDEVNCQLISPGQYVEFILPYEQTVLNHYGSMEYYHSCGNLTPLLPHIKTLNPKIFQVSPWTSLESACAAFAGTDTALEVWAHVTDDVMYASAGQVRDAMARRAKICRAADIAGYSFISGNIQQVTGDTTRDERQIQQWADVCRFIAESV